MLSDPQTPNAPGGRAKCLNAPYGARRFLTEKLHRLAKDSDLKRLNAPYGARCFLTLGDRRQEQV